MLTTLEVCAGGGGAALGLEQAGFSHLALVDNDTNACATLRLNRPEWKVFEADLTGDEFDSRPFKGVDLFTGGLPCPPFSVAGKQLGTHDERNLFPSTLDHIDAVRPRAVLIENVPGILSGVFQHYRRELRGQLEKMGYYAGWHLLNASDFGVPQLRPRVTIVAIRKNIADGFEWPTGGQTPPTVGEALYDLMAASGWRGAAAWKSHANEIAPTVVGGSLKHGGPDLGPTRAKRAWASLGVDGMGIADAAPNCDFVGMPRLTVRMVARLQGFPDAWEFAGRKTTSYRQVGNAFPPPVAKAVAEKIAVCLTKRRSWPVSLAS